MSVPSISKASIDELRSTFLNNYSMRGTDSVHPQDLTRVKNDDNWLERFLKHQKGEVEKAHEMLWTSVTWRKEQNINELKESDVDMNLLCSGIFFPVEADVDGCSMLVFKCSKHSKGSVPMDIVKTCINYWFERLERQGKGKEITMFFDMESCGLGNMDLEVIKYFILLLKEYYPYFLNNILIYEMPWILSAAFKIVKAMLPPEGVAKIRFVSRKDIKTYVPLNKALKCWGGESDFVFSFVPETIEEKSSSNNTTLNNNNRKVHFVDGSMSEVSANSGDKESVSDGGSLKVTPSSFITFLKDGKENISTLELQNMDSSLHISYKLKTTSPEKFSVKPSTGCLAPGESMKVVVTVLQGYQIGGLSRDKFLVMSIPLESNEHSNLDFSELWKNTSGRNIFQHRLKCIQGNETGKNENTTTNSPQESDNNYKKMYESINQLKSHQIELHKAIKTTQYYQIATVFLMLILGISFAYVLKTNLRDVIPSYSYCREDHNP